MLWKFSYSVRDLSTVAQKEDTKWGKKIVIRTLHENQGFIEICGVNLKKTGAIVVQKNFMQSRLS